MVGLEITRIDVADKWGLIFAAILIVLAARSVAVYVTTLFTGNIPNAWKHILNWGGLKGSLSIALVLSLPRDFDGREDILILYSVLCYSPLCARALPSSLCSTGLVLTNRKKVMRTMKHCWHRRTGMKMPSRKSAGSKTICALQIR